MFYGIMKLQEQIKQNTIAKKAAVDVTARSV
jgi:hypothetical protein